MPNEPQRRGRALRHRCVGGDRILRALAKNRFARSRSVRRGGQDGETFTARWSSVKRPLKCPHALPQHFGYRVHSRVSACASGNGSGKRAHGCRCRREDAIDPDSFGPSRLRMIQRELRHCALAPSRRFLAQPISTATVVSPALMRAGDTSNARPMEPRQSSGATCARSA